MLIYTLFLRRIFSLFSFFLNTYYVYNPQVVKTQKRTPSFTTRRRTQSFRRHGKELPPVEIEG